MDVKLRVMAGKHTGKEIPLARPKFLIGRADDCHLRAGSDLISRHHCVISVEETQVTVKDFGSRNGTYLNDQRIEGQQPLRSGDRLRVGPLDFEIVIKQSAAARPAAKPVAPAKPAAAKSVEDSISEWLGEPAPAAPYGAAAETQTMELSPAEQAKVEQASESSPSDAKAKKEPGKLPPVPQVKAKDSREAAANVLRELAKRR